MKYKTLALVSLFLMPVQMAMSVLSALMAKHGLKPFYRSNLIRSVKESDIVISYSDENFKEGTLFLPSNIYWTITWWTILASRTWDILVARYFQKRLIVFPNSLGPFKTSLGRFLTKLSLNRCDTILLRDPQSMKLSGSLGIRTQRKLTFDITWLFESNRDDVEINYPRPLLGVSPGIYSNALSSKDLGKHLRCYAHALDNAIDRFGFFVLFLPNYITGFSNDDLEISESIARQMLHKNRTAVIRVENAGEYRSLIAKMDIVVSSRLHPLIFALSNAVPSVCVAYDYKQMSLMERIGLIDSVIRLDEFSESILSSKIQSVWTGRDQTKGSLERSIPDIKRNVSRAIHYTLSDFCHDMRGSE